MAIEETGGWCDYCQRPVLGRRQGLNNVVFALFSLFSCGLFLIIWGIAALAHSSDAYACPNCGGQIRPGAGGPLPPAGAQPPLMSGADLSPPSSASLRPALAVAIGILVLLGLLVAGALVMHGKEVATQREASRPTSTTTPPLPSPSAAPIGHPSLSALTADQRARALARIVQSAGDSCPSATRTFLQGSSRKHGEFWNVQCSSGSAYVVQIKNDAGGSTSILDCAVNLTIGTTPCFQKFAN
jgi:hypothetical protein